MCEKNLWEKLGDLLAHPGKRFLIGAIIAVCGGIFTSIDAIGTSFIVFGLGFLTAISILESNKTYYLSDLQVCTPTGEIIPCAVIKQRRYAFIPVVPFICPFFYVTYIWKDLRKPMHT